MIDFVDNLERVEKVDPGKCLQQKIPSLKFTDQYVLPSLQQLEICIEYNEHDETINASAIWKLSFNVI